MIVQLVPKDSEITEPLTNVLVLGVTTKDIRKGCQADKPGLYGFRFLKVHQFQHALRLCEIEKEIKL